jgi:hypothetical protein
LSHKDAGGTLRDLLGPRPVLGASGVSQLDPAEP